MQGVGSAQLEDPALDVLVGVLGFELLPNAVSSISMTLAKYFFL